MGCARHSWLKDTRDVVEEILILEVSLLADFVDGFQEQVLPARPLVLQQNHHVAQRHVVPAVRESPELPGKTTLRQAGKTCCFCKYVGLISPMSVRSSLGAYFILP